MTAEEVKALQVGTRVDMIGKDPEGNERCIQCTVAFRGSPANKFLTYRDKGVIKHCAIKDYPGKQYMRVSGDRESGLLSAGSTPAALTKGRQANRRRASAT